MNKILIKKFGDIEFSVLVRNDHVVSKDHYLDMERNDYLGGQA